MTSGFLDQNYQRKSWSHREDRHVEWREPQDKGKKLCRGGIGCLCMSLSVCMCKAMAMNEAMGKILNLRKAWGFPGMDWVAV
mmetsp:Transcript_34197/g.73847  ORF Transcript_34197/g.73847 Transcript_34197/m.73847 type:complete len:82 (-) Transcript_34197:39-284(-)